MKGLKGPEAPKVVVCLGAGGVGKTSCSAALALAYAATGRRVIAVTLDPARRLGDALDDAEPHLLNRLYLEQPDASQAFGDLARELFEGRPGDQDTLAKNRIYKALSAGLAGIHEMAILARLPKLVDAVRPDVVVIDTAPSRHALHAMRLSGRILELVDSRVISVIARLLGGSRHGRRGALREGLGNLARKPVARILRATVGERPVVEMAHLLDLLLSVRKDLSAMATQSDGLLKGENTSYVVVLGHSDASVETAIFLSAEVTKMGVAPDAFLLNRATRSVEPWLERLNDRHDIPDAMRTAVQKLHRVSSDWQRATDKARARLKSTAPDVPVVVLPRLASPKHSDIVSVLSDDLGDKLLPVLDVA